MYLIYTDESGDSGMNNSPTLYFVAGGLVLHELRWQGYLDQYAKAVRGCRLQPGQRCV